MPVNRNKGGVTNTDRIIIALTSLALNAPSTYTIAWSKGQHPEEIPILYAGIATSAATVLGAILGEHYHGDKLMWGGLLATLGLFSYVAFVYKPKNSINQGYPIMLTKPNGSEAGFTHLMV